MTSSSHVYRYAHNYAWNRASFADDESKAIVAWRDHRRPTRLHFMIAGGPGWKDHQKGTGCNPHCKTVGVEAPAPTE